MVDLVLLQTVSYIAGALGVCVAGFYYVMNLRVSQRNQDLMLKSQEQNLETRQAQLYTQITQRFTETFWDYFIKISDANWSNFEEFQEWYRDKENMKMVALVLDPFENAGVLVRKNLLDVEMVAIGFSGMTRMMWEKLGPMFLELRGVTKLPRLASEFEYLYHKLVGYMEARPEFTSQ